MTRVGRGGVRQAVRRYRIEMSFATLAAVLAAVLMNGYASTGNSSLFLGGVATLFVSAGITMSARWRRRVPIDKLYNQTVVDSRRPAARRD